MTTISADNGIYIAEFPTLDGGREWRVIHAQAIGNLDYYPEGSAEEAREIVRYYGNAEPYSTVDEASKRAFEIQDDYGWTEYGVCMLMPFEHPMEVYRNRASACPENEQGVV